MTITQVAAYLGVNRSEALRLMQSGEIRGMRWDQEWMVPRRAVEEYLERRPDPRVRATGQVGCLQVSRATRNRARRELGWPLLPS
jgi:excisionase family DNA binding protein